jgi:hypothetical protein
MGSPPNGGQTRLGDRRAAVDVGTGNAENEMSKADAGAVERIIANTINETARGDPDALAARIVAALGEAGHRGIHASAEKLSGG